LIKPMRGFQSCETETLISCLSSITINKPRAIEFGIIGGGTRLTGGGRRFAKSEDLLDTEHDAPIIRLLNALIAQALKDKASDIHIETYANGLTFGFAWMECCKPNYLWQQTYPLW